MLRVSQAQEQRGLHLLDAATVKSRSVMARCMPAFGP
jgi:hypothetical protein